MRKIVIFIHDIYAYVLYVTRKKTATHDIRSAFMRNKSWIRLYEDRIFQIIFGEKIKRRNALNSESRLTGTVTL